MMQYIHNQPDWPSFHWNREQLTHTLSAVRYEQGRLIGRMEGLGFQLREEAVLETLTDDVLKSSNIEGERLDTQQVRSSVARRLGMDVGGLRPVDRHIEGIVEMMLDATRHYGERLTVERLFGWHASLFPTGRSGMRRIIVGAWRDDAGGPMQVISGRAGREHIHFEAPPAEKLEGEMRAFLEWFNGNNEPDWLMKAAVAHLWFVTLHPFEDGNGRIARAIADLALARSENSAQRFYSMSAQIERERNDYYRVLESAQRGTLDVTSWLDWFLGCLGRAIEEAESVLGAVMDKARFWEAVGAAPLNERQRLVLNRLVDGFEGKLTTSKWAKLAKCSSDTALRDIQSLVERGILVRNPGGGRNTSYDLARR
jgi:Fic family protein